jgi:hypothetical protein
MFMPGHKSAPAVADDYDWRTEKAKLNLIGKARTLSERQADAAAQADTRDRFRMAQEAKARGASQQEIRLILEA